MRCATCSTRACGVAEVVWVPDSSYCYITARDTKEDALEVVGGKGRSLAKLANAGFPVPGGFQVTTAAYRHFVAANELQERIVALARPAVIEGRASFEQSSAAIGQLFADTELSAEIGAEVRRAYGALEGGGLDGDRALAVRSSANAEDLPGLSFAGQQETFLNVTGAADHQSPGAADRGRLDPQTTGPLHGAPQHRREHARPPLPTV